LFGQNAYSNTNNPTVNTFRNRYVIRDRQPDSDRDLTIRDLVRDREISVRDRDLVRDSSAPLTSTHGRDWSAWRDTVAIMRGVIREDPDSEEAAGAWDYIARMIQTHLLQASVAAEAELQRIRGDIMERSDMRIRSAMERMERSDMEEAAGAEIQRLVEAATAAVTDELVTGTDDLVMGRNEGRRGGVADTAGIIPAELHEFVNEEVPLAFAVRVPDDLPVGVLAASNVRLVARSAPETRPAPGAAAPGAAPDSEFRLDSPEATARCHASSSPAPRAPRKSRWTPNLMVRNRTARVSPVSDDVCCGQSISNETAPKSNNDTGSKTAAEHVSSDDSEHVRSDGASESELRNDGSECPGRSDGSDSPVQSDGSDSSTRSTSSEHSVRTDGSATSHDDSEKQNSSPSGNTNQNTPNLSSGALKTASETRRPTGGVIGEPVAGFLFPSPGNGNDNTALNESDLNDCPNDCEIQICRPSDESNDNNDDDDKTKSQLEKARARWREKLCENKRSVELGEIQKSVGQNTTQAKIIPQGTPIEGNRADEMTQHVSTVRTSCFDNIASCFDMSTFRTRLLAGLQRLAEKIHNFVQLFFSKLCLGPINCSAIECLNTRSQSCFWCFVAFVIFIGGFFSIVGVTIITRQISETSDSSSRDYFSSDISPSVSDLSSSDVTSDANGSWNAFYDRAYSYIGNESERVNSSP